MLKKITAPFDAYYLSLTCYNFVTYLTLEMKVHHDIGRLACRCKEDEILVPFFSPDVATSCSAQFSSGSGARLGFLSANTITR